MPLPPKLSCRALVVLLAALLAPLAPLAPSWARADAAEEARAEAARLRTDVETLRTRLTAVLEGCAARPPGIPPEAPGAVTEVVFVPRSRVSLTVQRDAATGDATIATLWQRTVTTGILPRREWFQLGARQDANGAPAGAWLELERHGGGGSVNVPSGRIEADGSVIELPVEAYDVARREPGDGAERQTMRVERLRFAVPPDALGAIGGSTRARFVAGSSAFDLSDEHLTAFAALAARLAAVGPTPAAPAR